MPAVRHYQCANCKGEFQTDEGWTESAAMAEASALLLGDPLIDRATLCDGCYSACLDWFNGLSDERRDELEAQQKTQMNA